MKTIFRTTDRFLEDVRRDLARPHPFAAERVGFISVRATTTGTDTLVLLAADYHPVADDEYVDDRTVGAMMGQEAIRKALEVALLRSVGMIHVHMHEHDGRPRFSKIDVREQLKFVPDFFKIRREMPHGAVVLSHNRANGRVWLNRDTIVDISEFDVVGRRLTVDVAPFDDGSGSSRMTAREDFSRQSFLGEDAEKVLAGARVVIVGLGGGGSHVAQQLAHAGVGHFRLIDPQDIEASNLNRLVGATENDVIDGTAKVEIAKRLIHSVRPWADVRVSKTEWQAATDLLKDAHVVFGCVDGYRQRMYLESAARRFCLAYIDIGMDVTHLADRNYAVAGQMIATRPDGPCMRCLGFLTQQRLDREENDYADAGINPQVVWTNGTLASLAVGAFVRLLTPWFDNPNDFDWLELDGNNQLVSRSRQPNYSIKGPCLHFTSNDLGDPFLDLSARGAPKERS